jgi:hypothetical protein
MFTINDLFAKPGEQEDCLSNLWASQCESVHFESAQTRSSTLSKVAKEDSLVGATFGAASDSQSASGIAMLSRGLDFGIPQSLHCQAIGDNNSVFFRPWLQLTQ